MAAVSSIGTVFRVTTWGESHGTAIGVWWRTGVRPDCI